MANPELDAAIQKMAEQAFKTRVDVDQTPIEDVGDSLTLTELVVGLEQRYDIAFDDTITGRVRVVRDLIVEVEKLLAGRPPR
jgi:acyl carrier protein